MTIIFDHVHSDDLDPVLHKGEQVFLYGARVLSINHKRVEERRDSLMRESIRLRKEREGGITSGSNVGTGQESQAAD